VFRKIETPWFSFYNLSKCWPILVKIISLYALGIFLFTYWLFKYSLQINWKITCHNLRFTFQQDGTAAPRAHETESCDTRFHPTKPFGLEPNGLQDLATRTKPANLYSSLIGFHAYRLKGLLGVSSLVMFFLVFVFAWTFDMCIKLLLDSTWLWPRSMHNLLFCL